MSYGVFLERQMARSPSARRFCHLSAELLPQFALGNQHQRDRKRKNCLTSALSDFALRRTFFCGRRRCSRLIILTEEYCGKAPGANNGAFDPCSPSSQRFLYAYWILCICKFRPDLVSPATRALVLCLSLGAPDFFRKSVDSMEGRLGQRRRNQV